MNRKLEQLNIALKKALGTVILRELPELPSFTVSDVLLDPSFQHGRVWIKAGTETIDLINEKRAAIQKSLPRYVKTRYTPKLTFLQDDSYLEHIDELFSEIDNDKKI